MKRIISILLCTIIAVGLAGCGESTSDSISKYSVGESYINVYYFSNNEITCMQSMYQLKQPDSLNASIEEVMSTLVNVLPDDYEYYTYMLDENNGLTLEFMKNENISKERELLLKASVVKTLFQLKEVNSIAFVITDAKGDYLSQDSYSRESFYFYGYDEAYGLNDYPLDIYYGTSEGEKLTRRVAYCGSNDNTSVVESIVKQLADNYNIPAGTRVLSTNINDGVCYLELSEEFNNLAGKNKAEVVLYSIVNSITSVDGIDAVRVVVKNDSNKKYRGVVDISEPLVFNDDLLE